MRPRKVRTPRRRLALEALESRRVLATLYVATTGNDTADGSLDHPWQTLQHAANVVNPGDTVIVRAGNYTGMYLDRDGTATGRITFKADPGVTINRPNATTADGINLEGADYITIDGFNVVGMPRTGIRVVTDHDVILRNNDLDQNGSWGILTGFSDDILIENNIASRSVAQHGIYVSNSGDRPIIRDNIIWGNHDAGIHMNGDASMGGDGIISGALVEGNIIYDNGLGGGSGINCDGVQDSTIQNNIIYNEHASGISLYRIDGGGGSTGNVVVNNTVILASDGRWDLNISDGSTGNTVRNNILYDNHSFRGSLTISADSLAGFTSDYNVVMSRFSTDDGDTVQTLAQWQTSTGQDQHSLIATPSQLFVNAAMNDYHLSSTSPAVDKGTSQFAPAVDFEGTARPSGAGFDIGADELGTATPPPTNHAPTDINLSANVVKENSTAGTVVGTLSDVDADTGDTAAFTLLDNAGGRFAVSGNKLVVASGASIDYEQATSYTVVVRVTDSGGLTVDKSLTINVQNVNEVVGFDVQQGAAERSYIRYIDLTFESASGLSQLISEGRIHLTRYSLTGTNGVNVSVAHKLKIVGNHIIADFGSGGIGGHRNSSVGDGYYRVSVDTDGDGSYETLESFYRLLGDTNGDRTVNSSDQDTVQANLKRRGTNLNPDVNGDGVINTKDRDIVRRQIGRSIATNLTLDD
jgi:parallel beta-helix repeat protein